MSAPWLARLLLRLIRGPGSEYLRGDLEEWRLEHNGTTRAGARRSYTLEVLRSLIQWWSPGAVAARQRQQPSALLGDIRGDVRQAFRGLVKRPGYSLLVIAVMGIGIGAATSVLTIVDHVLLRPLPFPESERLVTIGSTFPNREWSEEVPGLQHLAGFSVGNFLDWENRVRSFDRLGALERRSILLPDRGSGPELLPTSSVTPGLFDILRTQPALGRNFFAHEYSAEAAEVVMISYTSWKERFGGDPAIIGKQVSSVGAGAEIIGVLPADFQLPEALGDIPTEFWFPIRLNAQRYADRSRRPLVGIGRLRPAVSLEAARTELRGLATQIAQESPDGNVYPDGGTLGIGANSLQAETVGAARLPIVLFMAASLLLLLIAGLNAANLVLVRGLSRGNEVGVRRALGAARSRLVRLFVSEALTLAILGGCVGLALAYAGIGAFRRLGPASIPRLGEIAVDQRIALIACLVTLICGLFMGLVPALRLTSDRGRGSVGSGFRTTTATNVWSWTVGAQVALSMLLMASAGLLMESSIRMRSFSPGFNPDSALIFRQGLKRPGAERMSNADLWDETLAQVRAVPGYTDVAAGSNLPFQSPNWAPAVLLPGEGPETMRSGVAGYAVSPNYFTALGIALHRGRAFESGDRADSRPVVVVNEAFVRTHLGDREPLGMALRFREGSSFSEVIVVGVVGNTVQGVPEDGFLPAVYIPYAQTEWPEAWVFARATGNPMNGLSDVRRKIAEVNAYIPPRDVNTMTEHIGQTRTGPRFNATLALAFGLVSLLLAAGGLYGTLTFGVRRRAKEIGVRMAMGASRRSVLGLILGHGLRLTMAGASLGLVAALLSGSLLQRFLFDVRPTSLPALAVVTLCLLVVATLACLAPALAASRVDPMRSLGAD